MTTETAEPMAYIGRDAHGCIRFAAVDAPETRTMVAREIASCIRSGLLIERVTCEYVRQTPLRSPTCPDHQPRPAAPKQEALL